LEAFLLAQRASGHAMSTADLDDYRRCIDSLESMLHRFAAGREPPEDPAALAAASQLADRWTHLPALELELEPDPAAPAGADSPDGTGAGAPLDSDLLPVFVEEAVDILPDIGDKLRRWQAAPTDRAL